ncbi:hypothetical protein H4S06_004747, partial [Coemansia sp. BCRC 34490]
MLAIKRQAMASATQILLRPHFLAALTTAASARAYHSKLCKSSDEAIKGIKSGDKLLIGGFGLCGIPENLLKAIARRKDIQQLTA